MEGQPESKIRKRLQEIEISWKGKEREKWRESIGGAKYAEKDVTHPIEKDIVGLAKMIFEEKVDRGDTDLELLQFIDELEERIKKLESKLEDAIKKFEIEPEDVKSIRESLANMASERQKSEKGHQKMVGYDDE